MAIQPTGPRIGGLPTLTPAQFALTAAARKPGASYKKYRQFINTRRGVIPGNPAWPGSGGPGLPTLMSMLRQVQIESPAQIQARTNKMVADQVKAQKGLVGDEATRAAQEAQRRMESSAAAGRAAAALNQDLFGMVGGEYNAGARELAGLSTGGVSEVGSRTAEDVAATNAALSSVGMPGIDNRVAGPMQGAVQSFRSNLGAQNLATQGQAAQFGLAGLVGAQNLRATQEATAGFNQQSRDIEQKRADQIAEIARNRPVVAAETLKQLQDANRQQIALGSSLLQQRRAALQAGFTQTQTKKELKLRQDALRYQKHKDELTAAQQKRELNAKLNQIDPVRSSALGYVVDTEGSPIMQNGQRIPYSQIQDLVDKSAKPGGGKKPRLTPGQLTTLLGKGQQALKEMFYGFVPDPKTGKRIPVTEMGDFDENKDATSYVTAKGESPTGQMSYQQSQRKLMMMGIPPPFAKAMVDELYLRGGSRGRPVLEDAEMKLARKVYGQQQLRSALAEVKRRVSVGQVDSANRMIEQLLSGKPSALGFRDPNALR